MATREGSEGYTNERLGRGHEGNHNVRMPFNSTADARTQSRHDSRSIASSNAGPREPSPPPPVPAEEAPTPALVSHAPLFDIQENGPVNDWDFKPKPDFTAKTKKGKKGKKGAVHAEEPPPLVWEG